MANGPSEFRMGIAGCGRISQAYVEAIKKCDGIRLGAVMDVREGAAHASAEAEGCRAFAELGAFARGADIDGAVICAPPSTHREIACALMKEGIHVLCEKPFATTVEDAQAMIDAANKSGLTLMMASKFRYVEDIIRAKAIVASGMLGDVHFYGNSFCAKVDMRDRWNSDPAVAGGGVLIDNGTHSVDIVRYLLGPIRRVFAYEGNRVADLPVEDTVTLSFVTDGGVMGTIHLSWSIQMDRASYVDICGTEGCVEVGWKQSRYQNSGQPQWVSFGVGYSKIGAFENQVRNFVGTIRGTEEPVITMDSGMASVLVIEAAYRSLEQGGWVDLEG